MKCFFFSLILFATTASFAQDKLLSSLINNNDFSDAKVRALTLLPQTHDDVFAMHCLGRAYFHLAPANTAYYDSSIALLNEVVTADDGRGWLSGWSYLYLGMDYYMKGDYRRSVDFLEKCIRTAKTENVVKSAKRFVRRINLSDYFKNWTVLEGQNIVFHFQDTGTVDVLRFMKAHEATFVQNNKVFEAKLPKKIDFFVWSDPGKARAILGKSLGFTDPDLCLCNVRTNQTLGHELTHVLSYWAWQTAPKEETRFINEGLAVCFDVSNRNKRMEMARNAVKGKTIKTVLQLWKDETVSEELLYPVAGAFVQFLYERSKPDQFRMLVKNQSLSYAKQLYGQEFEKLVKDFDDSLFLKGNEN